MIQNQTELFLCSETRQNMNLTDIIKAISKLFSGSLLILWTTENLFLPR
jgi:hypothetical protein